MLRPTLSPTSERNPPLRFVVFSARDKNPWHIGRFSHAPRSLVGCRCDPLGAVDVAAPWPNTSSFSCFAPRMQSVDRLKPLMPASSALVLSGRRFVRYFPSIRDYRDLCLQLVVREE